ncbi:MAG: GHMP kinase [Armatimonadetes bacterium]|nr:GHMP kinase [Armatimonadota bacterium]
MVRSRTMTPDLAAFAERLRGPLRERLTGDRPVVLARAPGRLDVFGGIIDYCGGTVCEMPLGQAVRAALQPRDDRVLHLHSTGAEAHGLRASVDVPLDQLLTTAGPREYHDVCAELGADPAAAWARYAAGAWLVLAREGYTDGYAAGADVVIESDVPFGAGVSSSAAIEMAVLTALTAHLGLAIEGRRLARLGQMVENLVVGAPCGLMDQLTVTLGAANALLVIRCQPDDILGPRQLPAGVEVAAINTAVKHSVGGSRYTAARVAAFMAHAVIVAELKRRGAGEEPFGGYLARVPREEYLTSYRELLPIEVSGAEFLESYGGTADRATRVEPETTYRVRAAADHQVLENARTPELLEAFESFSRTREPVYLERAGERMLASHASYRDHVGLGAPEADLMVELAMARGPANGVYGAKITGGGSGGSVAILGDARLPGELAHIAEAYRRRSGLTPEIIRGSSDGALRSGTTALSL